MLPLPLGWSLMVPPRPPTPCKSTKSRLQDAEITKGRRSLHLVCAHLNAAYSKEEKDHILIRDFSFSSSRSALAVQPVDPQVVQGYHARPLLHPLPGGLALRHGPRRPHGGVRWNRLPLRHHDLAEALHHEPRHQDLD